MDVVCGGGPSGVGCGQLWVYVRRDVREHGVNLVDLGGVVSSG